MDEDCEGGLRRNGVGIVDCKDGKRERMLENGAKVHEFMGEERVGDFRELEQ